MQHLWSHQRRDFIECAAGQVGLTQWCGGWIERIASIYRLNDARLEHYDPGLKRQTPAFDAAQGALNEALDALFAQGERELAALPDQAREGKALRSLLNHRDGLSVFVDRAQVPMDNHLAERVLRGPVIGTRLSFGSDSENGARFTAVMYSVIATLSLNGIDVLRWINIHNLGSHILAIVRRRLPQDWTERYHTTPVLIETFVETPRYTGAVYKASGWTHVGATQGRGRYDRHTKRSQPKKDIWLRPLRKDWKRTLNR